MERVAGRRGSGVGWDLGYLGRPEAAEPERSDAARNRRKILEAARGLFEERGVTNVTMEEVARASGVGKGTLYRRFPHKGFLCEALLDEPTRELQGRTLALLGERQRPALERLDLFLGLVAGFTEENLDLLYGGNEPLCGPNRLERFTHPAYDWRRSTVLGLLRAAAREGTLDPGLDLDLLAAALLAPLDLDLYFYQRRVQGLSAERIEAGVRSLAAALGATTT